MGKMMLRFKIAFQWYLSKFYHSYILTYLSLQNPLPKFPDGNSFLQFCLIPTGRKTRFLGQQPQKAPNFIKRTEQCIITYTISMPFSLYKALLMCIISISGEL